MNLVLHIFRKDLRRLRLHIVVFAALVGAFAMLDIAYDPGPGSALEIPRSALEGLITLTAWWLVATAVHEEPLIGGTAFWRTRPYSRPELLFAKVLLFAAVILLPLLLSDCLILAAQGLPLLSQAGGLLLRQAAFGVWLILPPFGIAALTRDLTQYAAGWFLVAVCGVALLQLKGESPLLANDFSWSIVGMIAFFSAALMAGALGLQYRNGRTAWNRALFAFALIPPALPVSWDGALGAQRIFVPAADRAERIRIRPAADRLAHAAPRTSNDAFCVDIPVQVSGLEEAWHLVMVAGSAEFTTTGGRHLKRAGGDQESWLRQEKGEYWQTACVVGNPGGVHAAATVSAVFAIMDEEAQFIAQFRGEPVMAPDVGLCEIRPSGDEARLLCRAGVRPPATGIVRLHTGMSGQVIPPGAGVALHEAASGSIDAGPDGSDISYFNHAWAPWHVLPGFSPVFKWNCLVAEGGRGLRPALSGAFVDVAFVKRHPIAFLQRTFTVPDLVIGTPGGPAR